MRGYRRDFAVFRAGGLFVDLSAEVLQAVGEKGRLDSRHKPHGRQRDSCFLEVSTVDRFQGRDKDCIIISLVRSNVEQNVGEGRESEE